MASLDLSPMDTETSAALRKVHHGLTYVLTFGMGWFSGVVMCVGMVKGWW